MSFAHRTEFPWQLRTRKVLLGKRTLVMGVLNVTPDSFSDGGFYQHAEDAVKHALDMLDQGADILDIGGESTRPGEHTPLSATEEQDRILPVIAAILKERPEALLSVDTYKAATARAAIEAGAEIVNDVSGFLWDAEMAATCAALQCGVILMHTRGKPQEWREQPPLAPEDVLPLVIRELKDRLQTAIAAGIPRERIVLDPGYGFGKRFDNNYTLLAAQDQLLSLGHPLLAGVSRKSFLSQTLHGLYKNSIPSEARLHATLTATTAAILAGAAIVRVHDVRPAIEAARIADAILKS